MLAPDYAGAAKTVWPGQPNADFRIDGPAAHGMPGLVNLFGIESPGLTASLGSRNMWRACSLNYHSDGVSTRVSSSA